MRELTVDGEDVMERTGRENLKEDAVTEREIAMAGTEKGVEGDYEVLISVDGYSSFKTSLGDRTLTGDSRFNVLSPEKIHSSISSYRLANDSLILSDNSTAFSSLNSLLDTILFSRASLSNFSLTNLLTANDQSISETCSTSNFKSSGILITNSAISITYNNIDNAYINNFSSVIIPEQGYCGINGYEDGDSTNDDGYVNKPFLQAKSLYKTFKKSFLVRICVILWPLKVLPIKKSYFLFRKKSKIILLMNTKNKNMLLFRGEIKRSMSNEEAMGERREENPRKIGGKNV
jgi:hypothetical protein